MSDSPQIDRDAAEASRRALGWSRIAQAYAAADADDVLADGAWAGFTKARATAWSWNFVQYEPFQLLGPLSARRIAREQGLAAGVLPDVVRYADRARELESRGVSPQEYRAAKETLGARTFTPEDVVQRGVR